VHTIKEAIYKCHVETKELNDWLVYKDLEGANESFTKYGLPTMRDISRKEYKVKGHVLPISGVHGNADHHTRSFLFVQTFTNGCRFTFKENGGIGSRCD
jgi:hypothetical protein